MRVRAKWRLVRRLLDLLHPEMVAVRWSDWQSVAHFGLIDRSKLGSIRVGVVGRCLGRNVVDSLFDILRTGCKWRYLPKKFIALLTGWAWVTPIAPPASGSQAER